MVAVAVLGRRAGVDHDDAAVALRRGEDRRRPHHIAVRHRHHVGLERVRAVSGQVKDPFRTGAGECALRICAIRNVALDAAQIGQTVEPDRVRQRLENCVDVVTVIDETTDQVRADESRGAGYKTADNFVSRVSAAAGSDWPGTSTHFSPAKAGCGCQRRCTAAGA